MGRPAGHVLGGDHRVHARNLQRGRCIDRADAAVRHRAAQDHGVEQSLRRKIIDVLAAATQEAQILAPLDGGADEGVLHRGSPSLLR
jgi:hypothetical protein